MSSSHCAVKDIICLCIFVTKWKNEFHFVSILLLPFPNRIYKVIDANFHFSMNRMIIEVRQLFNPISCCASEMNGGG